MRAFRSRFGGLWVDLADTAQVSRRLAAIADPALRAAMTCFAESGYAILPGAVSHAAIDAYLAELRRAAAVQRYLQLAGLPGGPHFVEHVPSLLPGSRILDTGMLLPHGQDLIFAPAISAFLETLFEAPALAMQSLQFDVGSTQTIHRDTAFVVVADAPMHLAASWIALEDISPGTGELVYYAGGHRIAEHVYRNAQGAEAKHWNGGGDRDTENALHETYLSECAARMGLAKQRFLARKGDVFIWHADLPHGGDAITRPGTRRSLVTHYCPRGDAPFYLRFLPADWQRKTAARDGRNAMCSMHYGPDLFAK
jgi:hypothetical protein